MTYAIRQIDITFQLGTGTFDNSNNNTLKLTGARCITQISTVLNNTAMAGGSHAVMRIYGIPLSDMNNLSIGGLFYKTRLNNSVLVEAGDAGQRKTTVFNGQMIECYPDFSEAPDTALVVSATPGREVAMKPVAPLSYPGQVAASDAFAKMASNGGMKYENNGVTAQFPSAYFPGTIMAQIAACAKWSNAYAWIDGSTGGNGTLVTVAQGSARGGDVPTISPQTGMIGYPSYETVAIIVRTLFDPAVKFMGKVNVQSDLPPANGEWQVYDLRYDLSSQMPDGPWEMTLRGTSSTTGAVQQ